MSRSIHGEIRRYVEDVLALHRGIMQLKEDGGTHSLLRKKDYGGGQVGWDVQEHRRDEDRVFPLDMATREQYERLFGVDLSLVRIHLGPDAEAITRSNGALAVSIGYDLYFSQGSYAPDSEEGLKLLAHELAHVVQFQRGNRLVYAEEIELMEEYALAMEASMSRVRLHGVHGPIVGTGTESGIDPEGLDEALRDAGQEGYAGGNPEEKSMAAFENRNRRITYRVQLPSGRMVRMSRGEYHAVMDRVSDGIRAWLEDERRARTTEEYEQLMLRYYSWLQRACA
ncbi:protein of unknown function [Alkalispirochaeta americana]|uniref:eCIS core domain-containing protein n=1 Tax=Alkalispirochaeta americana TaxID=159291 RepID=A0A1N6Y6N2_9SPIO|nr:DUF4157 domain-containing protein [Alkalispirochaeta americana]SIR10240.1 protein of unknown function [Alkalispirochaeta americana]